MTRDSDIYLRHSICFWCRAVCQFFENGLQIVRISERIHRLHARHNVNKQRAHSHLHRILNSHRRWERDNRHPRSDVRVHVVKTEEHVNGAENFPIVAQLHLRYFRSTLRSFDLYTPALRSSAGFKGDKEARPHGS